MNHHNLLFFLNFILSSTVFSTSTTTDIYKYNVDDDGLDVKLMDGVHIHHDANPLRYLITTNKNYGLGFTIGVYRDNVNLYVERNSHVVRSTPSNYTFYFFNDNNKYYIRNVACNFLCVDACGTAFMSPVRYKHHCKFQINSTRAGNFSIFIENNGKRRDLNFDSVHNILRINKIDTVEEYPFVLKYGPVNHSNKCQPIARTVQQILVVNTGECVPTIKKIKQQAAGVDVSVKKDDHQYYEMQLMDTTDTTQFTPRHNLFVKHIISPGMYVLQNALTCEFLCQNNECGVYMSNTNNAQCKIYVFTNRDSSFFVRFANDNYNLMYNTSTNKLSYAHSKRSRVKLVPVTKNKNAHRYVCNNLEASSSSDDGIKKECKNFRTNAANVLSLSIPNILFFLILSYNNTNNNK